MGIWSSDNINCQSSSGQVNVGQTMCNCNNPISQGTEVAKLCDKAGGKERYGFFGDNPIDGARTMVRWDIRNNSFLPRPKMIL